MKHKAIVVVINDDDLHKLVTISLKRKTSRSKLAVDIIIKQTELYIFDNKIIDLTDLADMANSNYRITLKTIPAKTYDYIEKMIPNYLPQFMSRSRLASSILAQGLEGIKTPANNDTSWLD